MWRLSLGLGDSRPSGAGAPLCRLSLGLGDSRPSAYRDLAIVAAATALLFLPWIGKAYHIDEPQFLAVARQILRDPARPLAFDFNWGGRSRPMGEIFNNSPLFSYLLAPVMAVSGGSEAFTRLLFLPLDVAGALFLYLLAARFLKEPLWPTLILVASPAYLINLGHLMPEKLAMAAGLAGLCAFLRGVDEDSRAWLAAGSGALALAILAKYHAVFFLPPAAVYGWSRRRRAASAIALAFTLFPLALYLSRSLAAQNALLVTRQTWTPSFLGRAHKLRSFLAFTGGCSAAPLLALGLASKRRTAWALAAALIIFLPAFDMVAGVRWIDRLSGVVMAAGAFLALEALWREREGAEGRFLAGWFASVAFLQIFFYWGIIARMILFLLPPLVFAVARALEANAAKQARSRLYALAFAGSAALTFALAFVDARYAQAQKDFAAKATAGRAPGSVWFSGHWGFQYYLEAAGARALDVDLGAWNQVHPGDVVLLPRVNSAVLRPRERILADVRVETADCPVPLRLMSGGSGEGGFYANLMGFLPYSISLAPLDEFTSVSRR